jgi:ribosomal-protein-alanine N-acetyltransferase
MPMVAPSGAHYDRAVTFSTPLADDIILRLAKKGDAEAIADAYVRNRQHLAEWEPVRSDAFFTAAHQTTVVSTQFGLHRLEASLLPRNAASRRVLARAGFESIGVAPAYLKIAGEWQHHLLTQRILA